MAVLPQVGSGHDVDHYADKSRRADYASQPQDHVVVLSNAVAKFGASIRSSIDTAGDAKDADTADLFTQISRAVDKLLWQVEAHAQ